MRDHRLVRLLERVGDLLVVVEQVPDALGGVDDVVEVDLELLGEEPLDAALQQPQRGALGLDDLAVRDDLLLHVGDVPDDLLGGALEQLVLDPVELVPDLVEDREAVVEEVVEDVVQQVAGALAEEVVAEALVVLDPAEEPGDGQQLDVRQRDDVVAPEEEVELGRVQPPDRLVVPGEVEDGEEIVRVLVDLRPLALREDVLEIELVPAEALGELGRLSEQRRVEMDPGQAVCGDLGEPRLRRSRDLARGQPRSRAPDPGQRGHGY